MTGSGVCTFGDPDDYEDALTTIGNVEFLAFTYAPFRAHLTRILLPHLRLTAGEEFQPRVAFISPRGGTVRILLPAATDALPIYGGTAAEAGVIITHRAGLGAHERLDRTGRWADILLPVSYVESYARALTGRPFALPSGTRWWLALPEALRCLTALHAAAIRVIEAHPGTVIGAEAAHGLEQELTDALIRCLAKGSLLPERGSEHRNRQLMARFEALRVARPELKRSVREISAALGVSQRTMRQCCKQTLNMGPDRYLRVHRLQLVRRALRDTDPTETRVSQVARKYGFAELGRFAASYRGLFGELPSTTLKG